MNLAGSLQCSMHKQTLAYFRKCEFERRWLNAESDCVRRVDVSPSWHRRQMTDTDPVRLGIEPSSFELAVSEIMFACPYNIGNNRPNSPKYRSMKIVGRKFNLLTAFILRPPTSAWSVEIPIGITSGSSARRIQTILPFVLLCNVY